jgi:hypothetical protein
LKKKKKKKKKKKSPTMSTAHPRTRFHKPKGERRFLNDETSSDEEEQEDNNSSSSASQNEGSCSDQKDTTNIKALKEMVTLLTNQNIQQRSERIQLEKDLELKSLQLDLTLSEVERLKRKLKESFKENQVLRQKDSLNQRQLDTQKKDLVALKTKLQQQQQQQQQLVPIPIQEGFEQALQVPMEPLKLPNPKK